MKDFSELLQKKLYEADEPAPAAEDPSAVLREYLARQRELTERFKTAVMKAVSEAEKVLAKAGSYQHVKGLAALPQSVQQGMGAKPYGSARGPLSAATPQPRAAAKVAALDALYKKLQQPEEGA